MDNLGLLTFMEKVFRWFDAGKNPVVPWLLVSTYCLSQLGADNESTK
ncbi:MAG: hypothetical protein NPIRA06_19360 [Nitrospirales bacterium]|nr:MAG: hypothetical protein NPIRA06_19360 [Nitrospirales bacterium]